MAACGNLWGDGSAGELRYNLIVDSLVGIIHKKPKEGGISAVGGTGSIYTYYGPEEVSFKTLTDNFLQKASEGRRGVCLRSSGGSGLADCLLFRSEVHALRGPVACPWPWQDLPKVMPSLELAEEPVPLWWTTDFILASPEGTPKEEEKWIVGEFNCSCVGISRCLAAYCKEDTPNASFADITEEDKAEAKKYGDLMGQKALGILSK